MKIIRWNVRGTGRRGFYGLVRHMIFKYNQYILVLMETKIYSLRLER